MRRRGRCWSTSVVSWPRLRPRRMRRIGAVTPCRTIFSPSTRARPRRAPSCSMRRWRRSRVGAAGVPADLSGARAGSSTIPRRSGPATVATARAAMAKAGVAASDVAGIGITNQRETTSSGTAPPASRSTTPSSGRTAAPPTPARRCAHAGHEPRSRRAHRPAARSVFLGHQDRLAARPCRRRARGRARRAGSPSAPSTASCSGG